MHRRFALAVASTALALLTTVTTGVIAPSPAAAASFTDIGGSTFKADIQWLAAQGITSGCSPTRFCPKGEVTREQMASFLARMFKLPTASRDYFTDDSRSKHQGNINRIAAAGVTTGCTRTHFCPKTKVTRAQMATFIVRAANKSVGSGRDYFHDDNGNLHEGNIDRSAAAGITRGCAAGRYCPTRIVTREQMAAFLHRVVDPKTPLPVPKPSSYDAVFSGDATGKTDVTASLKKFLQAHNGDHVALKSGGVYKVTQVSFSASNLTVDFRGARLQGIRTGLAVLRIRNSTNVRLKDARVTGTGYGWSSSNQGEHGIFVDGGSNIVLDHPVTRDTRGDGIYVGYQNGSNSPSKGVVINNPDIARAARSGIAAVAGEVTVRRGKINRVGLHGVNVEPNYATGAKSLRITVDRVDIRNVDDITAVPGKGYGVSSGWGYTGVRRPLLKVVDSTGDVLSIAASAMDRIIVTGNRSSGAAVFEYWNSGSVTFSGNTNIKKRAS